MERQHAAPGLASAILAVDGAHWAGDVVSETRVRVLAERLVRTAGLDEPAIAAARAFLTGDPR